MYWRRQLGQIWQSALTLIIVCTILFVVLRLTPGGPFDGEKVLPPDLKASIQRQYGLDLPLWKQWWSWMSGIATGDLKESFQYIGTPVSQIIKRSLPYSIGLGLASLILAFTLGVVTGIWSVMNRGRWPDALLRILTGIGISLPSFLLASLLILVFSFYLQWVPPALVDESTGWILPWIALALRPASLISRLVRAGLLETLEADYIRTAKAKGATRFRIYFKHALRNSLLPTLSLMGQMTAGLITGSFVIEVIFQLPGMGKYFISAVINRDYPLVMGITLTYGVVLLSSNFFFESVLAWLDPRLLLAQATSEREA